MKAVHWEEIKLQLKSKHDVPIVALFLPRDANLSFV
jgi:hypothetical protein